MYGKKHTKEALEKMSKTQFLNGVEPWNKGKKDLPPSWNKGIKMTVEQRKKASIAHIGQPGYWKGKKRSQPTKEKISKTKQCCIPWNKGKKCPQLSGMNCYMWKGGISKRYKNGYNSFEYRQWRRTVFIRDEFTCQKCGKKHIYITAHHIKSWVNYPELRFDINNGQTLCEDCHEKTDNYKGKNRNKKGVKL